LRPPSGASRIDGVTPRSVTVLVYPDFQALDAVGPVEVFAGARELRDRRRLADPGYAVRVVSGTGGPVRSSSGLTLETEPLDRPRRPLDTLVVAGGPGARRAARDRALVDWVVRRAARARRVASVCTGAYVLAAGGLLDGRRVTTHWSSCADLARRHPAVTVDPEPIYVRDGAVYTSAGVTAGMDLALALVADDLGREPALTIARWLVLFLHRPGNQAQFSAQLSAQVADRPSLRDVQHWMAENLTADLSVEALAERAAMSPRNFARRFRLEVGVTPGRYAERLRVEAARRRLEDAGDGMDGVAAACGFGSAETMRRAFERRLGVSPAEYRRRFRPALPA
jgi:transcriptional regulator GlxA family with amidase domain